MQLYRLLLRLFPRDFRARFGGDMADVFADRLRTARARGLVAAFGFWARSAADVLAHPWRTIIGVVGSVHHVGLTEQADPETFWPYRSDAWSTISVVVRGDGNLSALLAAVRPAIRELDPQLPVVQLSTVADVIGRTRSTTSLAAASAGIFSGFGLLLAVFGIFAVLSLLVSQRTREIGVRMALGATPAAVRRLVLRQSMVPAAVGCAAGGLLAIWLARGLSAMVLGIDARDPRVFGAAMAALLAAALAASWWPALRATRVDPMTTLRD
jgi:hypothetical protein